MSELLIFVIAYLFFGVIATIPTLMKLHKNNEWKKREQWLYALFCVLPVWPLWSVLIIIGSITDYKNAVKCAWCGQLLDIRDIEAVKSHVVTCKNHPLLNQLALVYKEIERLELDLEKALSK